MMYLRGIIVSLVTVSAILAWFTTFDLSTYIYLSDVMFLHVIISYSLFSKLMVRRPIYRH